MTDGETFLFALVLVYLSECLVWLPPSGYAIVSYGLRRWCVRRAVVVFEAWRRGFAVLQPLPPFGTVFVGQSWPVSLSAEGVAPISRENPNPGARLAPVSGATFLPWASVSAVNADGTSVRLNGNRYADAATSAGARLMAVRLRGLAAAPRERREALITRLVRSSLNPRRAARLATVFRRATLGLRVAVSVQFLAVFLVLPWSYWKFGGEGRFWWSLGLLWLVILQVVIEFWRLHRRFYPDLAADRWQHAVLALLFPHYGLRSVDALSRGFLAACHPLAVALALAPAPDSRRFARRVLDDAHHPLPLEAPGSDAARTAETFRVQFFVPQLVKVLAARHEAGHAPADETPAIGCPRCATPYVAAGIRCRECGHEAVPIRAA